jgi:four helix bundle protein
MGANYEESQSTTKKEFPVKIRISLREALETRYWLRFIKRLSIIENQKLDLVLFECIELIKILKSILSKTDN